MYYRMRPNNDPIEETKVGFILPYEGIKNQIGFINHLLSKLHNKYPDVFPYNKYNKYTISFSKTISYSNVEEDEDNLMRIKEEIEDLQMIICFGEKSYHTTKKVIQLFDLSVQPIKTKNIKYERQRSIKRLSQEQTSRFRTNFRVLDIFNDLDQKIIEVL